jgi:hypothetical protein
LEEIAGLLIDLKSFKMKKAIPFSLFLFLFIACEKEFEPPFDNQQFYDYHQSQNWTAESFKQELLGEWQFIYSHCCFEASSRSWTDTREENFVLKIEKDNIEVYEDSELQKTVSWTLETRGEDGFYLDSEEYIENTFGPLYIYNDYLLFHGSPADGPDSYFEKLK